MSRFDSSNSSLNCSNSTRQAMPTMHHKCRNLKYPRTHVDRLQIADGQVSWDAKFDEYNPITFTDEGAKGKWWSDLENSTITSWNQKDAEQLIDRTSYMGTYFVDQHGPRNPVGRTGLRGRGRLGRWGPNHAADPVVTRWKRDENHCLFYRAGKPVLQFIAIRRQENGEWAIPGGMVDPGESIAATLRREFGEDTMNSLKAGALSQPNASEKIDAFFSGGIEIYRGYVDDPRNTDNAWIETVAYNYHDEDGSNLSRFKLRPGGASNVLWMDVDATTTLYGNHLEILKRVVDIRGAYWSEPEAEPKAPRIHFKCRNATYPRSKIIRQTVPDDRVHWESEFVDYNPPIHTDENAKGKPWSDPELAEITTWNDRDAVRNTDRTSHTGHYAVDEYGPRNPIGRTGIRGRGCLGRWGPNHAADPIVTRWKDKEKRILQFVAIQRRDSKEWAIPGGMVDPGEHVTVTLKREFGEEALNMLEASEEQRRQLKQRIDEFFAGGSEVFRGYVDDPRNTDNAWMETVAYNFHDDDGTTLARFELQSGDDAVGVQWMDMHSAIHLYASHVDMIKQVVLNHDAHW